MPRRERHLLLGFAGVLGVLLGLQALLGGDVILHVAPLLVLVLPLLGGRYVGEDTIVSLLSPAAVVHERPTSERAVARRSSLDLLPRGGRLLASFLATRPPPRAAHVCA